MHNIHLTETSKNTAPKGALIALTEKGTNSGMYFGKAGIGAECNCKYFDCGLSDLRNSSLAVCKGGGMTAACIINYIICTRNSHFLQEKSRIGYRKTRSAASWPANHRPAPDEYLPSNNSSKTDFSVLRKGGIMTGFYWEWGRFPILTRCIRNKQLLEETLKSYYAIKLLRWSVLEILIPKAFGTPGSPLRPRYYTRAPLWSLLL